MALQTIESVDLTLERLFTGYYRVPDYQREYVWQVTEVEQLLNDIYDEHTAEEHDDDSEYFIGSIVVCASEDNIYELIDGQQRITTIFLVLCAIRDYLASVPGATPLGPLAGQIASVDVDKHGNDVSRFRVSLQYEDSRNVLDLVGRGGIDLASIEKKTRSVTNIIAACETIREFLKAKFVGDEKRLKRFYVFFTKNVKLIRVRTISVSHALKVFETINDRGVGLDAMDLLKNLMFMSAEPKAYEQLGARWKLLVDTLYAARERPLRFLRYFIFSQYDVDRLHEDDIYEWFSKNERRCGYKQAPLAFVERLIQSARAYTNFATGRDVYGHANRYLQNIRLVSGTSRQHLILLLAGQHLDAQCFSELCRHLENLVFAYILTREATRDFESNFARWAVEVRSVKSEVDLAAFIASRIRPAKDNLAARFALQFGGLNHGSMQQYRLRYILAKLTQYVDERAWGNEPPYADLSTYINSQVEIEHILPQKPSDEAVTAFRDGQPDLVYAPYIGRLGNLMLLEKSINASVGNALFEAKRTGYGESHFLLTKILSKSVVVGVDTKIDQAVKELETYTSWTPATVERRQTLLTALAHRVWEMPRLATELGGAMPV